MASSALKYANQLRPNDNKGPCGGVQLFDNPAEISKKFKQTVELMTRANNVVLHSGAGMSTAAGIPDFRGPSGVWTVMSHKRVGNKKRKMTDGDCTVKDTSNTCVEFGTTKLEPVEFSHALPSEAHLATLALLRAGYIRTVITQNIDGLHAISGMKHSECVELHGNVFIERCIFCARRYLRPYVAPTISFKPTGSHCGLCNFPPYGILTDVVLDWFDRYEDHFEKRAISHAEEADFHLTLGSSLHVEPACCYASSEHFRKENAPLVIVNYQKTRLDPEADVVLHCDVNQICKKLLKTFNIEAPTFIRKYYMVALRHGNSGSNTLLLRFPCIKSVMVDGMYTMASGVTHRCLDITRGLHEFSYTGNFEMSLQLWFEAEMKLKVVYSKEPILNGMVWQISLAATCGKYGNQNTEPLLHEFCKGYDQPVTVSSLTLAHNANMIPKSEVCRLVGILDCTDRVIPEYEYQSMPMHVKRLYELYSKLNDSGKVNIQGLLDVKVEDILDTLDAIDNVEVLPDITKASIRVGLELNLGSVDRNQFCIDVDALVDATPGNTFTVQAKRFHHMQLLCLSGHEFGELVSNVTKVMRLCLPRKIKPVTSSRLTTINTMERLTHYAIQCSVERVLQHRDITPPMVNVLKIFTTQFPLWIMSYLTDMFECR